MNKKICYLSLFCKTNQSSGVCKKIHGQIRAFESMGFETWYTHKKDQKYYLFDGKEDIYLLDSWNSGYMDTRRLLWAMRKYANKSPFDYFYVRGFCPSLVTTWCFRYFQKMGVKVILEIPTYPFAWEATNLMQRFLLNYSEFLLPRVQKYIDAIVNCNFMTELFGRATFPIKNCVDTKCYPLHFRHKMRNANELHLIAVSELQVWQGFDRVIESLVSYYEMPIAQRKYDVYFHLVGDGHESGAYKELATRGGIQDKVKFYGYLSGDKLNDVYEQCDLAIGGLALFRKKLYLASTLKTKEYCARGIPFVIAYDEIGFSGKEDFILRFPNDDSKIDMENIIRFHERTASIENLPEKIRQFCEENFAWEKEFRQFFQETFDLTL